MGGNGLAWTTGRKASARLACGRASFQGICRRPKAHRPLRSTGHAVPDGERWCRRARNSSHRRPDLSGGRARPFATGIAGLADVAPFARGRACAARQSLSHCAHRNGHARGEAFMPQGRGINGLCIGSGFDRDRERNALGGARRAAHALPDADADPRRPWRQRRGQLPVAQRPRRQGRNAELDRVARAHLPGRQPVPQPRRGRGRCRRLHPAQQQRDGADHPRRCHRRDHQPHQPVAGARADRRHPARGRRQGGGHAQGVPQDRRGAESRRGGAPRAGRAHGAGGGPEPLPRLSQEHDRAAGAPQEPRQPPRRRQGFQPRAGGAAARAGLRRRGRRPGGGLFPHRRHHRHAQGGAAPLFGHHLQRLAGRHAFVHARGQRDLPAAAVPCLCLPRDPDGLHPLGRARGLSHARRGIAATACSTISGS